MCDCNARQVLCINKLKALLSRQGLTAPPCQSSGQTGKPVSLGTDIYGLKRRYVTMSAYLLFDVAR